MSKKPKGQPKPVRDRGGRERALVEAAKQVLAEDGFQGFGVNAVARRAGCDKQLIYRYFGGVEGLVGAIGAELAERLRDHLAPLAAMGRPKSYTELVQRMALGLMQALREDLLLRRITAWEVSDSSALVKSLTAARSRGMALWVGETRGDLVPPAVVDAAAVNAVIIAAVQHLVIAAASAGEFAGLALRDEADWERARGAVKALVNSVYEVRP
ncbi:MAG: TetR/AcrR family transcriptional regulator [Micropepsaceae bacterium]